MQELKILILIFPQSEKVKHSRLVTLIQSRALICIYLNIKGFKSINHIVVLEAEREKQQRLG